MAVPNYDPQLAMLSTDAPSGGPWLHEIKYDGYRIGCRIAAGRIALMSRRGQEWTDRFPEIRAAAAKLRANDAFLDGEVAFLLPDGRTSFQALQNALRRRRRAASSTSCSTCCASTGTTSRADRSASARTSFASEPSWSTTFATAARTPSVAAFSTRARPGLPVSIPLDWDELDPRRALAWDVRNVPRRLRRLASDPWGGHARLRQRLSRDVLRAVDAVNSLPAGG